MHPDEFYTISQLETNHWWYRSLHNLVLSVIKGTFNNKEIKIVDAGCGTGGLMMFLHNNGYKNIQGFDNSKIAVKFCRDKGLDVFEGDIKAMSEYFSNGYIDVVVSNDTFYFLDEIQQMKVTNSIHGLLKEKGLLILNMPSLKTFRGIHDLRVGIRKRFNKRDKGNLFDCSKYVLVTEMYWPFMLSFGIWLMRYIQRVRLKINKFTTINSDLKNYNKIVNGFLFHITNAENRFLNKKPFGSSLFLVLKTKSI